MIFIKIFSIYILFCKSIITVRYSDICHGLGFHIATIQRNIFTFFPILFLIVQKLFSIFKKISLFSFIWYDHFPEICYMCICTCMCVTDFVSVTYNFYIVTYICIFHFILTSWYIFSTQYVIFSAIFIIIISVNSISNF